MTQLGTLRGVGCCFRFFFSSRSRKNRNSYLFKEVKRDIEGVTMNGLERGAVPLGAVTSDVTAELSARLTETQPQKRRLSIVLHYRQKGAVSRPSDG